MREATPDIWPASDHEASPAKEEDHDSDDALSSTLEMGKTDSEREGPANGPPKAGDAGSIDGEPLSEEEAEEEQHDEDPVVEVESHAANHAIPDGADSSESEEEHAEEADESQGSWWGKAYTTFGPSDRLERTRVSWTASRPLRRTGSSTRAPSPSPM